jgi:class 3 adenylate cyclase
MAITVIVKQAFYKSWWFIGLCFLIVLALVFGTLEYQLYRSQQQKKELQRQVKERTVDLERAMKKSDELLLNILPHETAEELKKFGKAKAKRHEPVTVLFTDFKGFTQIAEQLEPGELVTEIDYCFRNFDAIIEKYNIEKIKTIGDAYMCVGGIPNSENEDPQKVVLAALEIRDFMANLAEKRIRLGKSCFEIRIGVHTGEVVAGIVGTKKSQYDVWGDTVNVAARMEDNSESGKVNISGTTYELVKDYFKCEHRGKVTAKNKGEIDMYFVERPLLS